MTDTTKISDAIKGLPDDALVYVDAGGKHNRMFKAKNLIALVAENESLKEQVDGLEKLNTQSKTIVLDCGDALLRGTYPDSGIKYWMDTRNNVLHATAFKAFESLADGGNDDRS